MILMEEIAAGVDPETLELCDLRPDPKDGPEPGTGLRGIDNFEAFMNFLAPTGKELLCPEASPDNPLVSAAARITATKR